MSQESKEHHASVRPKTYDGSKVVAHPVQAGESLASIAKAYLMKDWKPLWIYNAQVRKTVGDDPDLIRKGVTIFIPRSPQGYADLIKKLEIVRLDAEYLGDTVRYELEAEANNLEAFKLKLDFAADVALTVASLGLKATAAAKAADAVEVAKGQAKIAQQLSANAITKDFATEFAKFRSKYVAEALKQHGAKVAAQKAFQHKAGQKLIGIAAGVADAKVKERVGEGAARFKDTYKAMTTMEKVGKAWKEVGLGAKAGSFVLIALDFLKPSELAEWALLKATGENATSSQQKAASNLAAATKRTLERLDAQIAAVKAECKLLYG